MCVLSNEYLLVHTVNAKQVENQTGRKFSERSSHNIVSEKQSNKRIA